MWQTESTLFVWRIYLTTIQLSTIYSKLIIIVGLIFRLFEYRSHTISTKTNHVILIRIRSSFWNLLVIDHIGHKSFVVFLD